MMRSRSFWIAALGLWGLALLLPRPTGRVEGKRHPHWPPANLAVYYGEWDAQHLTQAARFQLIVAHPGARLSTWNQDLVNRLRQGPDGRVGSPDDTLVLAYLSVGEDEDPPRGPEPFPRRYLDRQAYRLGPDGFPECGADGLPRVQAGSDGVPDRNGAWGSYPVNPADPEWRALLEQRLRRLAESGVDGFFLDTLDVAGDDYKDLQPALFDLIERLHRLYPDRYWVANRGVGLLQRDPARFGRLFDGILLESWFAQWDWTLNKGVPSPYLQDNLKLLREVLDRHTGLARLYLDYFDPHQPDRGLVLAQRGPRQPGFWSHPFLDRLEGPLEPPSRTLDPPALPELRRTPQGLLEFPQDQRRSLEVWADNALLHGSPPWPVGSASRLRLRRVDFQGNASPWREAAIPPAVAPTWQGGEWTVLELDRSLQFDWPEPVRAEIWAGPEPSRLRPSGHRGASGLRLDDLPQDQLIWVALAPPGGAPEPARPARPHDTTPPPTPQGLRARRHGVYLTLDWQAVSAADLDGYRVYVGRPGSPLPLPYEVHEPQWEGRVPSGPLEVRLTSYDGGNHESRPTPRLSLPAAGRD